MERETEVSSAYNFIDGLAGNMLTPNTEKHSDTGVLKLWWTEYKGEYFIYSEWNNAGSTIDAEISRRMGVVPVSELSSVDTDDEMVQEQFDRAASYPIQDSNMVRARLGALMGLDVRKKENVTLRANSPKEHSLGIGQETLNVIRSTRLIHEMSDALELEPDVVREMGIWKWRGEPRIDRKNNQVYIVSELQFENKYPCLRISRRSNSIQFMVLRQDQKLGMQGCDGEYTNQMIGNSGEWETIKPAELSMLTEFIASTPQSL